MQKIKRAFEQSVINIKVSNIILTKEIEPSVLASRKMALIISSIREIGLTEFPVITLKRDGYYLLDGHLRVHALKMLDIENVDCLVSTDDEAFTYNSHVNRLSNVQEHRMIAKAIERGVSVERLARVMDMEPANIIRKKNLLKNICPEVVEMLKDKIVSTKVFEYLQKMLPQRQIEATKMMLESENYSTRFGRSLWLATSEDNLRLKRRKNIASEADFAKFGQLESEITRLQGEAEEIEDNYGINIVNLTVLKTYIKSLLLNGRIYRYLSQTNPEILSNLEDIADIENLSA